jgi:hypothetical protein
VVKRKTANDTLDETDDMDEEDVIETFVEQAKERLEKLGEKYPGLAIPEDEEIRRMVVLRLCRGLSVNEISKRLHRDNRVVNAAVSRVPRRVNYSYPIEDWEREIAKGEGRRLVSPEQASRVLYERPPASSSGLSISMSLSPETLARLYSLALMDGFYDVDLWINEVLIPWCLVAEQIRRDFGMPPGQRVDPNEFYEFVKILMRENAAFRARALSKT